jgi:[acyl-carrier-protein] S-malonyltransferase
MANQKTAVLFPGQGSQFVGMGREFIESDNDARLLMEMAESVSGYPLKKLCLEGPMADLTQTANLQPAVTITNLICWQAAKKAGMKADFFAGHSLGEYSALCGAGVLSAEDTMKLVTERGRLMEREAEKHPGSMRAVLGLSLAEVRDILDNLTGGGAITAANYNSDKQIVVSGEVAMLDEMSPIVADKGGRAIPLQVSGAWHSSLIQDAVPDFIKIMEAVSFGPPETPLYFNVTGKQEKDPAAIRVVMAKQIASMVCWVDIIKQLMAKEVNIFVEAGPKKVLSGLLKKIILSGYQYTSLQFDTPESLENCLREIN